MSTNFLMPLMMLVGPEGDQARKRPGVGHAPLRRWRKMDAPKTWGPEFRGLG